MGGTGTGRAPAALRTAKKTLMKAARAYPGAVLDHPWGEDVVKVNGKIFVFLGLPSDRLTVTVKLPDSRGLALELPFTEPTGYGLGKSGWITAQFEAATAPPVPMLLAWIEESYRAVAPKRLSRHLDAQRSTGGSGATAGAEARVPRVPARRPKTPRARRGGR